MNEEGFTNGYTVYEPDDEHPVLYGPDGNKLRVQKRNPLGFDLSNERKRTKVEEDSE